MKNRKQKSCHVWSHVFSCGKHETKRTSIQNTMLFVLERAPEQGVRAKINRTHNDSTFLLMILKSMLLCMPL